MAEDIVAIEIEFDTEEQCKNVHDIFYNLRAARRGEVEWPSEEELIEQVGSISEKAKELILTPLKGIEEEKEWLLEEIKPNKVSRFKFQWPDIEIEGAWVESLKIVHIFEPDDFPAKKGKKGNKIRISWMWNRCYLVTSAMMIKVFKELGAIKIKSRVTSEYG
jgi:hypothetical protein